MRNKKIVCFGGGSVMPKVVLAPLKGYPAEIASITSMADDGGSTGALRREFRVPAPGDLRRHMLAFSDAPLWKKELWGMRFGAEEFEGGHKGHNFGNIFLCGLSKNMKDYGEVLEGCRAFLAIDKRYQPLPASTGEVILCAELANGEVIEGESEIDVPKAHDAALAIRKIFLKKKVKAYLPALEAIAKADALIFGPGDLYSSTLPCLLPAGMKKAVASSRAKKILVVNIMNKRAETGGFTVGQFAKEAERYLGAPLDHVVYNNYVPGVETIVLAQREDSSLLEQVAAEEGLEQDKFIGANLVKKGTVEHDPAKVGKVLWNLIVR